MTKEELRENIESELTWRREELIFFKNQLANILKEIDKDRFRKSLILMLYSHFEGFMKICLLTYIQYLNLIKLKRIEVNENLIATSMHREFQAYDSNDEKCEIFRRDLPDDAKLHKLFRRAHLLEKLKDFYDADLVINDDAIDTESNLWYIVLQKNLFKVGLPTDLFKEFKRDIDGLVHRRNSLAHGALKAGISQSEYNKWEESTLRIMEDTVKILYKYATDRKYLNIVS